jgi:multidrug efflux pump subunit AcrA (membrane-fusion protein)
MMKFIKALPLVAALLGASGFGVGPLAATGQSGSPYRTDEVTQGDLLASFPATGGLEPEGIVDLGTQVAGQIKAIRVEIRGWPPFG